MALCSFQLGAADFKRSPQRAQLAVEPGKCPLHRGYQLVRFFARLTPKTNRAPTKVDQVAFVIGHKPNSLKTLHIVGAALSGLGPGAALRNKLMASVRERLTAVS